MDKSKNHLLFLIGLIITAFSTFLCILGAGLAFGNLTGSGSVDSYTAYFYVVPLIPSILAGVGFWQSHVKHHGGILGCLVPSLLGVSMLLVGIECAIVGLIKDVIATASVVGGWSCEAQYPNNIPEQDRCNLVVNGINLMYAGSILLLMVCLFLLIVSCMRNQELQRLNMGLPGGNPGGVAVVHVSTVPGQQVQVVPTGQPVAGQPVMGQPVK